MSRGKRSEDVLDQLAAWLEAEADLHFRLFNVTMREGDHSASHWHSARADMAGATLTELMRLRAAQEAE